MQLKRKKLSSTAVYSLSDARKSEPAYPGTRNVNEFLSMSLGERAFIARHMVKEFNPTDAEEPSAAFRKKYSAEWWTQNVQYVTVKGIRANGDTAHFILNACLFPERSQEDWKEPEESPVRFYDTVTHKNALGWYESCPEHLRKRIDSALVKVPDPKDSKPGEAVYDVVKRQWGDRPVIRYVDEPNLGKEMVTSYIEYELFNQWSSEYEKEAIRQETLAQAVLIQKERRMLNEAMGIDVEKGDLPSQAEGLDNTLSATVRWLQESGEMPLEFLARTYRSEGAKMSDRLTAARTLMDYVHRKVPVKTETETKDITEPKLDPKVLKGLSEKELEVLEKLLAKLGSSGG